MKGGSLGASKKSVGGAYCHAAVHPVVVGPHIRAAAETALQQGFYRKMSIDLRGISRILTKEQLEDTILWLWIYRCKRGLKGDRTLFHLICNLHSIRREILYARGA